MNDVIQLLEHPETEAPKNRNSANGKLVNVGFIGLGHMGAGMAANLLKAGHHVTVFNRTPAKARGADRAWRDSWRPASPRLSWRRGHDHAGQ